jgi:transposase
MKVSPHLLQHLGIVAGIFDMLGIGELIDQLLPKKNDHKIPHSIVVKAMIINGLGFTGQRLYLFPNFFKNLPVEMLLGEGITAEDLNDDLIGRTLDAIYKYGPSEFFQAIVLHVASKFCLDTQLLHGDTTNFSVFGKYKEDAPDGTDSIKITFGHAKDGRTDLKRFVLGMVTNQRGLPLSAKAYSGNMSDKHSIPEMIRITQKALDNFLTNLSIWIADSSFYTEKNIQSMGNTPWISRMPATLKEAKELLKSEFEMIQGLDQRYSFFSAESNYGGVPQKVIVVQSDENLKSSGSKFNKKIRDVDRKAKKGLRALMRMSFACVPDAEAEARRWMSGLPYHQFSKMIILEVVERKEHKIGRPRKDEDVNISYVIDAEIEMNANAIEKDRTKLGRFLLATNQLDLEPEQILNYYKGQQNVERGFRFLKDKSFHVSEVYLKKEERIESLSMIMVLDLFVYSFAEGRLRDELKEKEQYVPNQLNKPTQQPTMRWIFSLFTGVVRTIVVSSEGMVEESTNLDEVQRMILCLLGPECEKYYGVKS